MWVSPACSPTRACIITGKYGYRAGVKWANDELSNTKITLQKYITQETDSTYAIAVIGKWHLSGEVPSNDPYELTDLLIDTLPAEQSAAKSALETELGAIRN